jgi:hypothetical protein
VAAVRLRADDDQLGPFLAGDPSDVLRRSRLGGRECDALLGQQRGMSDRVELTRYAIRRGLIQA